VAAFAGIGADELIFLPAVGDLEEITRLADLVQCGLRTGSNEGG
jgi:hypothetical protein